MSRNHSLARPAAALTIAGAALALFAGCSGSETRHAGDIAAIRKDPSPAMESLYLRKSDKRNQRALAWDTTMRQMHDDGARLFHSDSPSRLTPVTKPY